MLLAILSTCSQEELDESDAEDDAAEASSAEAIAARRQQIKNKIMAVGKMQRVFQILRLVCLSSLLSLLKYDVDVWSFHV